MDCTPGAGSSRSSTPTPQRPHPTAAFHPHGDTATYRDLLLFEERLKMNAEMLRRRRRRYSSESFKVYATQQGLQNPDCRRFVGLTPAVFLYTFLLATLVMAHRLLFAPPQVCPQGPLMTDDAMALLISVDLCLTTSPSRSSCRGTHHPCPLLCQWDVRGEDPICS